MSGGRLRSRRDDPGRIPGPTVLAARLCYAGFSMSGDTKCTIATVLVAQAVVVVTVLVTLQTSLQRLGARLGARRPPAG